jgi:hypothetical protein
MRDVLSPLLLTLCLAPLPAVARPQSAESSNFVVYSHSAAPSAQQVLNECRSLRGEIHDLLYGNRSPDPWRPRCEVVVHASRRSYAAAVGRAGALTQGSSLMEVSAGRVTRRRVDVLVDEHHRTPALAHELTHVVLAEYFGGKPPRWADEGLALLADSAAKQRLHMRDLAYAVRSGTTLRLAKLMTLEQLDSPEQMPAFYAQSLSVVRFLVKRSDRRRFSRFVETAEEHGYDHALRTVYEIDGVPHLERLWLSSLKPPEAAQILPVSRTRDVE